MGIFKTPASVAATSGNTNIFFLAWFVGGFIAICGALTYAEIGLRLPVVGGYYKIFAESYHPSIGFAVNAIILISNAASLGVVALIGSDYISDLLYGRPADNTFNVIVAGSAVAVFFVVNLFGLKTSSRTQNFLIILKAALIVLLIASVLKGRTIAPHGYAKDDPLYTLNDKSALVLFIISMIPVCFSYGGYQQTMNFGGEVKKPPIIPKGIMIGMLTVIILYLLINYAYVQVIGYDKMKNATAIGALLCEAWFGKNGGKVFDALMFLSVMAYVNIILMSNPRVMFAMSRDKVFPKLFSFEHPKTGALVPALAVFSIVTVAVTFIGKGVDNILTFSMFLDCIGMSTSAFTLFILRRKRKNEEMITGKWNRYTPLLAAFFVFSYFMLLIGVIIKKSIPALIGTGLLLFFLGIYFVFYRKHQMTKINS